MCRADIIPQCLFFFSYLRPCSFGHSLTGLGASVAMLQPITSTYFLTLCQTGSEQQVEQTVDFQFAQTELMMNEMSAGKRTSHLFFSSTFLNATSHSVAC